MATRAIFVSGLALFGLAMLATGAVFDEPGYVPAEKRAPVQPDGSLAADWRLLDAPEPAPLAPVAATPEPVVIAAAPEPAAEDIWDAPAEWSATD